MLNRNIKITNLKHHKLNETTKHELLTKKNLKLDFYTGSSTTISHQYFLKEELTSTHKHQ